MKRILHHPLFSGSVIMVGGSLAANAINFVYHFVMGRVLTVADYGLLSSIFSILYIISIVPISSSFAIVKFISEADEDKRSVVYETIKKFIIKVALWGMVIVVLLSPLIANFLHIDNLASVVLVGPILFLSLVILVDQAAMQGILKFTGVILPAFVSNLAKLVFGLLFVYLGFSVSGAVAGVLVGLALAYYITVKLKRRLFVKTHKGKFEIKQFLFFALPVLIQAIAFTSIFTVDVILARHFLPAFEAGLYASLSTLGKIIYFAAQPVTATMFPIVTGKKSRGEKYKDVFILSLVLTLAAGFVITGFYYFFPNLAIGILYGSKYLVAAKELVWMGIFMSVYTVAYAIVNYLLSINKTKAVYIPLLGVVLQTGAISLWHGSILQIIQANLAVTIFIFLALSAYLGYISVKEK